MKRRIFLATMMAALALGGLQAQTAPLRIAVLPFTARNTAQADVDLVVESLETNLVRTNAYQVIAQSDIQRILEVQESALAEYSDAAGAARIGRLLTASRIVVGTVTTADGRLFLTARLIDVESGVVLSAQEVQAATITELRALQVELAYRIAGLSAPGASAQAASATTATEQAGLDLVPIAAGTFRMGQDGTAAPVHNVRITRPFQMSRFEITNAQAAAVFNRGIELRRVAINPAGTMIRLGAVVLVNLAASATAGGVTERCRLQYRNGRLAPEPGYEAHPLVGVTWYGAAAFCNVLSEMEGLPPAFDTTTWACDFNSSGYRLPTEAEWEYAARAGSTSRFYWGEGWEQLATYANFADRNTNFDYNERSLNDGAAGTAPVGSYIENAWGLYDIAGNVLEWCNDAYGEYAAQDAGDPHGPTSSATSRRVLRGGGWASASSQVYTSTRVNLAADYSYVTVGFRVVR